MKEQNLIYGLKDGHLVHIDHVERGLACECICPACGERLLARKGKKMVHHFAHRSLASCEYGYETTLHLMAKEILLEATSMWIPEIQIGSALWGDCRIAPAQEIRIDKVKLEQKTGSIIPDVIIWSRGKPFFVEIFVTHRVDEYKLAELERLGISAVEVNLNEMDRSISKKELARILLGEDERKEWVFNILERQYRKNLNRCLTGCGFGTVFIGEEGSGGRNC